MTRLLRQTCLMLCCTLLMPASVSAATRQDWNFRVMLDGDEIGWHRFEVFESNASRRVAIQASFDVRVLFFNAYRYRHQNYEVWRGECLQSIRSNTYDNGDREFVRGDKNDDVLRLQTSAGTETLPGCVRTFAYWDPAILNSHALLNAQTGELMPVKVKRLGIKTIQVHEKPVQATHYRIDTTEFSIELWYSLQQQWLALQSTTPNGAVLRYQLQ